MADSRKRTPSKNTKRKAQGGRKAGAAGKGQRTAREQQDNGFMRAEVMIVCSFAVAVLLFLSNFNLCGAVGQALRSAQLGLFGLVGFLAPILLFVGTCFHMSNQNNIHAALKLGAVILAVVAVCGLMQLLFGTVPAGAKWMEYYHQSCVSGRGGGWLGGVLTSLLTLALGRAGAYLVLLVILILSIVYITEKSFVTAVRRGSGKAYTYAREDMDRRREMYEQRVRERRAARQERQAREMEQEQERKEGPGGFPDVMAQKAPGKAAASQAGEDTAKPSGADVFSGHISMPADYEEQAGEEKEQSQAEHVSGDQKAPGGAAKKEAAGTKEPKDSYMLHADGQEEFFVPRDHRTLREMDFIQGPADAGIPAGAGTRAGAEPPAGMGIRAGAETLAGMGIPAGAGTPSGTETPASPELQTSGTHTDAGLPGTQPAEETRAALAPQDISEHAPWDEDPADRISLYAPQPSAGEPRASYDAPALTLWPEEPEEEIDARIPGAAGRKAAVRANESFHEPEQPGRQDYTDNREAQSPAALNSRRPETKAAGGEERPDFPADLFKEAPQPEEGAYDPRPVPDMGAGSLMVEEKTKRVVTASGKVIETDTELLQKKIEKKKAQAAQENAQIQAQDQVAQEIGKKEEEPKREYVFPPTSLLKRQARPAGAFSQEEYKATAIKLQQTLRNFGVGVTVTNISCGPTVTRYELLPEQGVKVSRIVGLADDIKLSLAAAEIRIEAPIPGKSAVGIEVPNKENTVVYLRELLESESFKHHKSRLAFAVGKDIGGQVVVTDIAKMPHLLIAGATGSGKSVCINTLIMSVIFKARPEDVKLIMVDPKVVELSVYNGIPHLLIPVVTDPKKASGALNWAVAEMTERYKKFAQCNVRDLKGYNERIDRLGDIEDKPNKLPQIIIIIDELADLMMVAPGEVEESICRLAQLARAAGIHLVIATQRPSVNVITGLIKANVPSRIAFSVSSGVDSRTIIDMNGAEKLLGKGDMLFYPAGFPKPQRVQGAFVSDDEVSQVVEFLTSQGLTAQYSPDVESQVASGMGEGSSGGSGSGRDEYFAQAGKLITDKEKASIGMLQRMFKIGFNRAARIMDQLAEAGVVGEEEGTKPRKVLMTPEEFEQFLQSGQ